MLAFKRVESIRDKMTYITLRDRSCGVILNVHAPTEEKGEL
jgi:hypothetical protein